MAQLADWKEQYRALKMTADEAVELIQDGDRVAMPGSGR
jgi:acyl-CoA hydrolase